MDKKDLYEHLANIYLDASSKKKKKPKRNKNLNKIFFISIIAALGLGFFLFTGIYRKKSLTLSEIALVLTPDAVKVNFNFDPAKKEIYSLNLNKLNLAGYKRLAFSLKKNNYFDNIALRVEFANIFNEKSFVYLKDIAHRWKDYQISFSDFKSISDWSEMTSLSFVVEEWNTKENRGVVYIDNVRVSH